jgi:hypothetical protein
VRFVAMRLEHACHRTSDFFESFLHFPLKRHECRAPLLPRLPHGRVIREPNKLVEFCLQRIVFGGAADAFVAGGLGDAKGDGAADFAQVPQAGI